MKELNPSTGNPICATARVGAKVRDPSIEPGLGDTIVVVGLKNDFFQRGSV